MKIRNLFFIIVIGLSPASLINAQSPAQDKAGAAQLMKQAGEKHGQGEYTTARYLYKQAYRAFATEGNYSLAVECGIQAGALYTREYYTRESLGLFLEMEQLIASAEEKQGKPLDELRFAVSNERLQVYSKIKDAVRAKNELSKLDEIAKQAGNDSLNRVKLYSEAGYYYAFGLHPQGDAATGKLVDSYMRTREYGKAAEVYKDIIEKAKEKNNTALAGLAYDRYIQWADSVKDLKAKDELDAQMKKYEGSLRLISEKDDALSARMYIITGLCILSVILAGVLVFLAIVLLRFIARNRTLKKGIETANEHNMLKSEFIHNISGQMAPTLDAISGSAGEIADKAPEQAAQIQSRAGALQKFCDNIQELSALENSLAEPYEMTETDVNCLCQTAMDKVRGYIRPEIPVSVNVPSLKIKTNREQLERILLHLLTNAALHTQSGYIVLDFKRRGARVFQFIVTDSGPGIPGGLRDNLFKPFTGMKDLSQGDGLGLPICSLIAVKLNGSLSLDGTYSKGSRFILELRP
jgi:signal transduction histidine kinase